MDDNLLLCPARSLKKIGVMFTGNVSPVGEMLNNISPGFHQFRQHLMAKTITGESKIVIAGIVPGGEVVESKVFEDVLPGAVEQWAKEFGSPLTLEERAST